MSKDHGTLDLSVLNDMHAAASAPPAPAECTEASGANNTPSADGAVAGQTEEQQPSAENWTPEPSFMPSPEEKPVDAEFPHLVLSDLQRDILRRVPQKLEQVLQHARMVVAKRLSLTVGQQFTADFSQLGVDEQDSRTRSPSALALRRAESFKAWFGASQDAEDRLFKAKDIALVLDGRDASNLPGKAAACGLPAHHEHGAGPAAVKSVRLARVLRFRSAFARCCFMRTRWLKALKVIRQRGLWYSCGICSDLRVLFAEADLDGSGEVSATEWSSMLYRLELSTWPTADEVNVPRAVATINRAAAKWYRAGDNWFKVFRLADQNSGRIDFNDFQGMVRQRTPGLGINKKKVSDQELKGLWRALDSNLSSDVRIQDFMVFMRRTEREREKKARLVA
ncbi:unnamed protein product [Effrenium voratum]|nr:unnamed protein product [Effrenium voratum]